MGASMARAKKVVEIIGVHRHRDRLRVDITLSSGERKRVCVCEWSEANAVLWAGKRAGFVPVASPREDKLAGATQEK